MSAGLIDKLRLYLERFEYPNIHFLDDEQIADLFSPAGRKSILIWLVQNLSTEIVLPTEWSLAKNVIAQHLYENGFCRSSQMHLFVKGDVALPIKDEITIFERIFEYLSIIRNKNIPPLTIPKYNIESLINTDLNIFPTCGVPLKLLTPTEKQEKINVYKQKIADLKKNCAEHISDTDTGVDCMSTFISEIYKTPEVDAANFETKSIKFQNFAISLNKMNGNQTKEEVNGFGSEITPVLKTCAEETVGAVEYLKSLNIILPSYTETIEELDNDNQMYDLVTRIAHLAVNTKEALKYKATEKSKE